MSYRFASAAALALFIWVPAYGELRFESGDDFFISGRAYWAEIYCSSREERGRWMGSEHCELTTVRPSQDGFDRLIGTSDTRIDVVELRRGKSATSLTYDGKRGISQRFRLIDLLAPGEQSFTYRLLGKKTNGQRPQIEAGEIPIRAEFRIDPMPNQTYHYWAAWPGDRCLFRPPREQVCAAPSAPGPWVAFWERE
jgi:hypothetical protein